MFDHFHVFRTVLLILFVLGGSVLYDLHAVIWSRWHCRLECSM